MLYVDKCSTSEIRRETLQATGPPVQHGRGYRGHTKYPVLDSDIASVLQPATDVILYGRKATEYGYHVDQNLHALR